jgi:hypothetical protein
MQRPAPPAVREQLDKALELIDAANAGDPQKVPVDGVQRPYRVAYSDWLIEWVRKLDPKASDELLILAKGRCKTNLLHGYLVVAFTQEAKVAASQPMNGGD